MAPSNSPDLREAPAICEGMLTLVESRRPRVRAVASDSE